jgi:hypothetical protein
MKWGLPGIRVLVLQDCIKRELLRLSAIRSAAFAVTQ